MGKSSNKTKKRRYSEDSVSSSSPSSSSPSSSSESDDESFRKRHKSSRSHRRRRSSERGSSRREKEKRRENRKKKRREKSDKDRKKESSSRRSKREGKRKVSNSDTESEEKEYISSDGDSDSNLPRSDPVDVVKCILEEFPAVADDLKQLLCMIDDGQAVDISGLSEKSLVKYLRKLFLSLNLNEKGRFVFMLPSDARPTLEVVGAILGKKSGSQGPHNDKHEPHNDLNAELPNEEHKTADGGPNLSSATEEDVAGPRKRVIGPAMPSAELLAAAAKLTEAEAELRDAEIGEDDELFIGPPPPAVVKEAASANDAERFEEVTRIMGAEVDNPYDVVGVNRNMSADNIKKRYWKLSLMVHPDKCPHPEAHQAFIKLNKAFKDLQDPVKRKAMDDKIDEKEEKERFKLELKAMREAAQWRRLQGISMEGDDALLAEMDVKVEPRRDEWMTTLPPERKPGVATQQSTKSFSRTSKEGRGDTSAWTDTPSERAQKAKMNYLEAYNEAAALAANEQEKKTSNTDAEMVDQYNKAKRSKSLMEKHQESTRVSSKKKSKGEQEKAKAEWEGQHPWKPWDREKDLTAGRQNVKLDAENMSQGLTSRFASGSFQRNFL